MVAINLLEELGDAAKEEEIIEGMEDDDDDGDDGDGEDGDGEEEPEYDEHIWLSLRNAQVLARVICDALADLNPAGADAYRGNLTAYIGKLTALDAEYQAVVQAAPVKTILVGDRFPFRYLVDDYGIGYHAAFPGCSAETEASFDTIIFLAEKMDELGLTAIVVTESADQEIAKTIRNNTQAKNQKILVLDAIQSISATDVERGSTYISLMQDNLTVLEEALGG
jgi:zinc transport system substrate-binding protein